MAAGGDKAEVKFGADTSDFEGKMAKLQKTTQQSQEKISKLGTSVSGLGFALGGLTSQTGQTVTAFANFAGVLGTTGLVGAGIAATAFAIGQLVEAFGEVSEAADKALDDVTSSVTESFNRLQALRLDVPALTSEQTKAYEEQGEAQAKLEESQQRINQLNTELSQWIVVGSVTAKRKELKLLQEQVKLDEARVTLARELVEAENREANTKALAKVLEDKKKEEDKEKERKKRARQAERKRQKDGLDRWLREQELASERAAANRGEAYREAEADELAALARVEEAEYEANRRNFEQRKKWNNEDLQQHLDNIQRRAEAERTTAESRAADNVALARTGADSAMALQGSLTSFAQDEALALYDLQVKLDAARKRGDEERVEELKELQKQNEETFFARVLERVSMEAIAQGNIIAAQGVASFLTTGNPGGLAAAGVGAVLAGAGIAGSIGSSILHSGAAAQAETRAFERSQREEAESETGSAPSRNVGPGRAVAADRTTVVNYYFGGPVFGNQDDAARAVARFNQRGRSLEGMN